jgi:hypothetical protein
MTCWLYFPETSGRASLNPPKLQTNLSISGVNVIGSVTALVNLFDFLLKFLGLIQATICDVQR